MKRNPGLWIGLGVVAAAGIGAVTYALTRSTAPSTPALTKEGLPPGTLVGGVTPVPLPSTASELPPTIYGGVLTPTGAGERSDD